jgi:hypothetical protein
MRNVVFWDVAHIPEDGILYSHSYEILKSQIVQLLQKI